MIRSPGRTSTSSSTRIPLMRVPFRDPRSRMNQRSPSRRSSAWRRETDSSASRQSQLGARPRLRRARSPRGSASVGMRGRLQAASMSASSRDSHSTADSRSRRGVRAGRTSEVSSVSSAPRLGLVGEADALGERVRGQPALDGAVAKQPHDAVALLSGRAHRHRGVSVGAHAPILRPLQAALLLPSRRSARGITKRMPERSSSIEQVLLSIRPSRLPKGTSAIWLRYFSCPRFRVIIHR